MDRKRAFLALLLAATEVAAAPTAKCSAAAWNLVIFVQPALRQWSSAAESRARPTPPRWSDGSTESIPK